MLDRNTGTSSQCPRISFGDMDGKAPVGFGLDRFSGVCFCWHRLDTGIGDMVHICTVCVSKLSSLGIRISLVDV